MRSGEGGHSCTSQGPCSAVGHTRDFPPPNVTVHHWQTLRTWPSAHAHQVRLGTGQCMGLGTLCICCFRCSPPPKTRCTWNSCARRLQPASSREINGHSACRPLDAADAPRLVFLLAPLASKQLQQHRLLLLPNACDFCHELQHHLLHGTDGRFPPQGRCSGQAAPEGARCGLRQRRVHIRIRLLCGQRDLVSNAVWDRESTCRPLPAPPSLNAVSWYCDREDCRRALVRIIIMNLWRHTGKRRFGVTRSFTSQGAWCSAAYCHRIDARCHAQACRGEKAAPVMTDE